MLFTRLTFDDSGPMQMHAFEYFRGNPQRYDFPTQRVVGETERYYGILDQRLASRDCVAGPGRGRYSIASIAIFPFFDAIGAVGLELGKFPNVFKWWERIGKRYVNLRVSRWSIFG